MATCALFVLPHPASWIVAVVFAGIAAYAVTTANRLEGKFIVRLKGLCVDARRFLSRLAHHRRHRLRQNPLRHQSIALSGFSKRSNIGAAFALMTRACIGKRSWKWRRNFNRAERFDFVASQAGQPAGKMETTAHLQFAFRPDHSAVHLRKIRRGHGDKLGPARRAIIFQKSGANAYRPGLELLTRMDMEVTLENVRDFLLE